MLELRQMQRIQVCHLRLCTITECCCRYDSCCNTSFCGGLKWREVKLKSGARDVAVETRFCSQIQDAGLERAQSVQAGTMVGSECTNETEPYIISLGLTGEKVWMGEPGRSWMGSITAGEKYITTRKLIRGATENMYVTTELEFYLHSEDVRVINMQHSKIEVRRSSRQAQASNKESFLFNQTEIETLKSRCWDPNA